MNKILNALLAVKGLKCILPVTEIPPTLWDVFVLVGYCIEEYEFSRADFMSAIISLESISFRNFTREAINERKTLCNGNQKSCV